MEKLEDRVKYYEGIQTKVSLNEEEPICVRIDGKTFHTYTKNLVKPYDHRLSQAMIDTMNFLVEETNARLGYTQSDEISLVYFKTDKKQQSLLGGRVQKLNSVLASMATAKFNSIVSKTIPENDSFAFFDCRIWNVPTLQDVADVFLWRQNDAIKNSISMAGYANFEHNQLQEKNSRDKLNMLLEKGIDWNDYPEFFKTGTYARRRIIEVPMPEELKKFPANKDKDTFFRTEVQNFHLPLLRKVENLSDFLFKEEFENLDKKTKMKVK